MYIKSGNYSANFKYWLASRWNKTDSRIEAMLILLLGFPVGSFSFFFFGLRVLPLLSIFWFAYWLSLILSSHHCKINGSMFKQLWYMKNTSKHVLFHSSNLLHNFAYIYIYIYIYLSLIVIYLFILKHQTL